MKLQVTGVNRAVAFALAAAWLCAGVAGIGIGAARRQFLLLVSGVLAIAYALLWLRLAARSRLLTWREIFLPLRRRQLVALAPPADAGPMDPRD